MEARSVRELIFGMPNEGNLDSNFGFLEYLIADWEWLHNPEYRAAHPWNRSMHNLSLRESQSYRDDIQWAGPIPRNDQVLEFWNDWRR